MYGILDKAEDCHSRHCKSSSSHVGTVTEDTSTSTSLPSPPGPTTKRQKDWEKKVVDQGKNQQGAPREQQGQQGPGQQGR